MQLCKLLEGIEVSAHNMGGETEVCDIAYDSRKVKKNSLFVAIKGEKSDGHAFINKALEQGASVIVGEEDLSLDNYIRVKSSRKFLAEASKRFFDSASDKMKIVGITGTNGKTTVTYLIKQILEFKGYKCGLIGTNQILIGDEALDSERTTPESRDLHEIFKRMADCGTEYVVMEVSSHSLELDRVHGIEFEVGVFTNLTRDHLDFHITMENYARAKAKLFKMCRHGVVNVDDEYAPYMLEGRADLLTLSAKKDSLLRAENIELNARGVRFDANYKGERDSLLLGIPGKFSVYNALSACGAVLSLGLSLSDCRKGLETCGGVKGRLEVVPTNTPYTVVIDYAHTPDGLEKIIDAVRGFARGRVITLFGCGGDRDNTKRPIMGQIAQSLSDIVIVTSDNPRTEEPSKIMEQIVKGMTGDNFVQIENRREAIGYALEIAKEGDVVILAGKGHETYQIFKDGTIHFDEREVVREFLEKG